MTMPDEPGPNDPFWEQLKDIEVSDDGSTNVQNLNDLELADQLGKVREQLHQLGEMMHPTTQQGRELHSRRSALLIEIHKRHP